MTQQMQSLRSNVLRSLRRLAKGVTRGARRVDLYLSLKVSMSDRYHPRPDDLFIACFAKSGTTLMQMMLYQLTTPGEMDFPHIASVAPWFESCLQEDQAKFFDEMASPRIFKSHLSYARMPRGAKIIYLARDFRDVVVSAYHHDCLVSGCDLDFASHVDRLIAGQGRFGSWYAHLRSWWPHRNDPNVLFLLYEDIVADLPAAVRRVAEFCNLPLDERKQARVVERCSVSFMKQHAEKFDPRLSQRSPHRRSFIRNGVSGEGRRTLSSRQEEQIVQHLAELARELGCAPGEPFRELLLPGAPGAPQAGRPEAGAPALGAPL
jgi:hypothetical protein